MADGGQQRGFRVVDAGIRNGRFNIALDQAMIDLHQAGKIPDTLRFIHFPPTALVGRHQVLGRELDLSYCANHGIGVARRVTGGGAIYMDPGQLGWALVFDRRTLAAGSLAGVAQAICEAVAVGLSGFGLDARFRPRNDIEVDGRKISGTGGFFDGDTLIYQGTVLVDTDPEQMSAALRVPGAKLQRHAAASASQRVVSLRQLLGDATPPMEAVQSALLAGFAGSLGLDFRQASLQERELALAQQLFDAEIGRDEFVHEIDEPAAGAAFRTGSCACPGGTVTAMVRFEGRTADRIGQVLFSGDFFVAPPRVVFDLEAALKGLSTAEAGPAVERFFTARELAALSVTPADFREALEAALTGKSIPGGLQT